MGSYVVGAAAAPPAPTGAAAPAVGVLAGAPLRRGGVGVLALARHRGDGVEHLGGHVGREGADRSGKV